MKTDFRKWLAIGTGVGIEITAGELQVTIARVRPSGVAMLGSATVDDFRQRPAAEWGRELHSFLKKLGCGHIAVNVLLPRHDVIVRQVHMPGVSDRDLTSAIQLQIDSLHPFAEEDAAYSWARIGKSPYVLVGITRREVIDRYSTMFAEAGLKVASFTFSAAVLYAAIRLFGDPPQGFVAIHESAGDVEVYGESDTRPVFSATFDRSPERAVALAASELRLAPDIEPLRMESLLPKPTAFTESHDPSGPGFGEHALPYAAALAGACPWLSMPANLLPPEQRKASSRVRLIPTIALASILGMLLVAITAHASYENARYLTVLRTETKKLEPAARRVDTIDRALTLRRSRTEVLDSFRRRSKADMDVLNEVTKLIAPPGWVSNLEITRSTVQVAGEVEGAAGLLKTFDASPLFEGSEFTMGFARVGVGEAFRLKTNREGVPK
jgi:hypothetical protein